MFTNHVYLISMYKEDLALNNPKWLICHKVQPNHLGFELALLIPFPTMITIKLSISPFVEKYVYFMAFGHFLFGWTKNFSMLFLNWWKGFKRLPTEKYVFSLLRSPTSKNDIFTQSNLWVHLSILKTQCFLRQVVVFHGGAWLCTPNILALQTACKPVLILSMHSGSFTNDSFACHAIWTLWVKGRQMYVVTNAPSISLSMTIWIFCEGLNGYLKY